MVDNVEPFLYDYNFSLLRNFEVQQLMLYLKTKIKDLNKLMKITSGGNSWEKIRNILNEQVKYGYDDSEIEKEFFRSLVYLVTEKSYFIKISTDLTADQAFLELRNSSRYSPYVNRKLSQVVYTEEELISIRITGNKIIFMFKLGVAELGNSKEKCSFYVPCILDFKHNYMEIRLNQHRLSNSSKVTDIKLKGILRKLTDFVDKQLPIALRTQKSGEAKIHQGLYKLFLDESNRSLELIKNEVIRNEKAESTEVTEKKIFKYLKEELHISNPESFIDKVMTVKYQDTARFMDLKSFIQDGGYIFGFSFIDRKITRSINRNENHQPVYLSKIYWSLKEIIQEFQEITELAVYWKFNKTDFKKKITGTEDEKDISFVEVGFKEIHGVLEVHYYVQPKVNLLTSSIEERGIKEEYVIQKIKRSI